jgi:hypothetical protein
MFHRSEDKRQAAALLVVELRRIRALHEARLADHAGAADRIRLMEWQTDRLRRTYSDLVATLRYAGAARFFLEELYGPKDFSKRDHDLDRISPIMVRMLPANVIETVAKAMELNALSQELDNALLAELDPVGPDQLREADYVAAYRRCDNYDLRLQQIDLIGVLGRDLDRIVRKRFIAGALQMMRRPAAMAGFSEMHDFLEMGFTAFREMGGADYFLTTVMTRERRILDRIVGGHAHPFELE